MHLLEHLINFNTCIELYEHVKRCQAYACSHSVSESRTLIYTEMFFQRPAVPIVLDVLLLYSNPGAEGVKKVVPGGFCQEESDTEHHQVVES